jgi:hypothetical protein
MFTLDDVVPWGRSFDEYRRMFALADDDLRLRIVGCGDGPASFNAEATRAGARVTSCDPIYQLQSSQIRDRIDATCDTILAETRRNIDGFVWDAIESVEALGRVRMAAMREFLDDFGSNRSGGRYVAAALPALPFRDRSFDLALSSHLVFLYSEQLGEAFHQATIREMCRVADDIRIFPLLALNGKRSPFLESSVDGVPRSEFDVTVEAVPYEFQRGGNQMMRIRRRR